MISWADFFLFGFHLDIFCGNSTERLLVEFYFALCNCAASLVLVRYINTTRSHMNPFLPLDPAMLGPVWALNKK